MSTISEPVRYYAEAAGTVDPKQPGASTWGSWVDSFQDKTLVTANGPVQNQ